MSTDIQNVALSFVPSVGIDKTLDPTSLGNTRAQACENLFVDSGALRVRGGTERTTYSNSANGNVQAFGKMYLSQTYGTSLNDASLAVVDGTLVYWDSGNNMWSNVGFPLPAGLSLNSEDRGTFIEFRDNMYYVSPSEVPLRISPTSSGGLTIERAGVQSPDVIKVIDRCQDTETYWTPNDQGGTSSEDRNVFRFVMGSSAMLLTVSTANTTGSFKRTFSSPLDLTVFPDGSPSDGRDYFSFYFYRWKKARIREFIVNLGVGSSPNTDYYSAYVVSEVASFLESYRKYKTIPSMLHEDPYSYKLFRIDIRKSWFRLNGNATTSDWNNITQIEFVLKSDDDTDGSANEYARVTIDYIHLRAAPPTVDKNGFRIATFDGDESWIVGSTQTEATRTPNYAVEGMWAVVVPRDNYVKRTFSPPLDIEDLPDGSALSARDMIRVTLCGSERTTLNIKLKDDQNYTAETTFACGHLLGVREFSRRIAFFLYRDDNGAVINRSVGPFGDFHWNQIVEITLTAGIEGSVYVDNLILEQHKNVKLVHPFEAVDVLAVQDLEDFSEEYLNDYPYLSRVTDHASEYYFKLKYRTFGDGELKYPETEIHEPLFSTSAMSLTAFGTSNVTAANFKDVHVEGFRVVWSRYKPAIGDNYLDLSKYFTFDIGDGGGTESIEITDEDEFRVWVCAREVKNLSKIKFRLYINRNSTGTGFYQIPFGDDDYSTGGYYEYVWDVSLAHSKETEEVIRKLDLREPEYVSANVPVLGNVQMDKTDLMALLSDGDYYIPATKDNTTTFEIVWKRGDMVKFSDNLNDEWDKICGYGIEVVGQPDKGVTCVFDNWTIRSPGRLNGMYWYRITNVDALGQESAASLPSEPVYAKHDKVYVHDIQAAPPGVEYRRLYRKGGTDQTWRLVGVLSDPNDTEYIDNWPDDMLREPLVEGKYEPPKANVAALISNRMFYADFTDRFEKYYSSRVAISEPFKPGMVDDAMQLDLDPQDGTKITGITEFAGYTVVFKERSIWTISPTFVPLKREHRFGCIAKRSIAVHEGGILFLSHEGVLAFNMYAVDEKVGLPVRDLLRKIPTNYLANAVGKLYDEYYFLWYDNDGTGNRNCLVLHTPTGAWTECKIRTGTTDFADVRCAEILAGDSNEFVLGLGLGGLYGGSVVDFMTSNTKDFDYDIQGTYVTGDLDLSMPEREKIMKAAYIRVRKDSDLSGSYSYTLVPYVEQVGTSTSLVNSSLGTAYETRVHIPKQHVRGFIHGFELSTTGRVSVSAIKLVYDVLPLRIR